MYLDTSNMMRFIIFAVLVASSHAFFLKWGSDTRPTTSQKSWVQPIQPNVSPSYRYQYSYSPYDSRKMYQIQPQSYPQPEVVQQSIAPIPISIPAGAALTPVSLQHVQLVPCMCPVAPEEAEKLQEVGTGPFLAQTYNSQSYSVPQQIAASPDASKATTNQQQ